MKTFKTLFISILAFMVPPAMALETSVEEEISLAYTLSKAGKYADAVLRVQPLLNALKLDTVESIILGNKILTVSYCELNDLEKAKEYLESVRAFSPDESFKEFSMSPTCLDFFGIKRQIVKKQKVADAETLPPSVVPNHLKPKDPSWKLYMPFGTGQFYNEQSDKGWAFLATETLGLVAATTMFILFQSEKNSDGTFSNTGLANAYKTTYWSSLGVAGGASIWGIVDALIVNKKRRS
jgi:hypothetical protein